MHCNGGAEGAILISYYCYGCYYGILVYACEEVMSDFIDIWFVYSRMVLTLCWMFRSLRSTFLDQCLCLSFVDWDDQELEDKRMIIVGEICPQSCKIIVVFFFFQKLD